MLAAPDEDAASVRHPPLDGADEQRGRRARLPAAQSAEIRAQDTAAHQAARAAISPEEAQRIQEQNADEHRIAYASLTLEQRVQRNADRREAQRRDRPLLDRFESDARAAMLRFRDSSGLTMHEDRALAAGMELREWLQGAGSGPLLLQLWSAA